jgi:hypothetical protein
MKTNNTNTEFEKMISHRFLEDHFAVNLKEHIEQKFREGKLDVKDWHLLLFDTNPFPEIEPDKADDRIVQLTLFYNKLKQAGLTIIPGYTGCRECYYRYVFTSLCLLNPPDINYQIISHTLYQHLCYLWAGVIDVQWQMLHQNVPHKTANEGYSKIFEDVAIQMGFCVDFVCNPGMTMRMLWKDGYMYKHGKKDKNEKTLDILPCHDCIQMGLIDSIIGCSSSCNKKNE